MALLDRNGTIVAVNDAWNRFAVDNGGTLSACGVGASYLEVCDAAPDDASRLVGDHIRAALHGDVVEALGTAIRCDTPTAELWFDVLVSSRLDDRMHCAGACVALVPVEAPHPLAGVAPTLQDGLLRAVADALDADRCSIHTGPPPTTRPGAGDGSRLESTSRGGVALVVERDPGRPGFDEQDRHLLERLGTVAESALEDARRQHQAAVLREVAVREDIGRQLTATTVHSILSALAALESVVDRAPASITHSRIASAVRDLEDALVGMRSSVLTGLGSEPDRGTGRAAGAGAQPGREVLRGGSGSTP